MVDVRFCPRSPLFRSVLIIVALEAVLLYWYIALLEGNSTLRSNHTISVPPARSTNPPYNQTKPNHPCYKYSEIEPRSINETWRIGQLGFLSLRPGSTFSISSKNVYLHNIRKLVLCTVHMINNHTKSNPSCVQWWANPLTTSGVSSTQMDTRTTKWKLRFDLEPGRIPVEAIILQNLTTRVSVNLQVQQEFTLLSVKWLDNNGIVEANLSNMCLCKNGLEGANRRTKTAREAWAKTDPELKWWPPNSSFMITDYVDYLDHNYFLISPDKYGYGTKNRSYCGPATRLMLAVFSAPANFALRVAIRKSYGRRQNMNLFSARLAFFLGTTSNRTVQTLVNEEAKQFQDVVQANFVDTYHNLTIKRLSVYQWIYLQCSETSGNSLQKMPDYLFKADDDHVLNLEAVLGVAETNPNSTGLIGNVFCGGEPIRKASNTKYYVPNYIYPSTTYPAYLSGPASLLRSELIPKLLQASLTVPLIHIEDVYMTGLVPSFINVLREHSGLFSCCVTQENACLLKKTVMSSVTGVDDLLLQWHKLSQPVNESCPVSKLNFATSVADC